MLQIAVVKERGRKKIVIKVRSSTFSGMTLKHRQNICNRLCTSQTASIDVTSSRNCWRLEIMTEQAVHTSKSGCCSCFNYCGGAEKSIAKRSDFFSVGSKSLDIFLHL